MENPRPNDDAATRRYVSEIGTRLCDRLPELSSTVCRFIEDQIPELRGDAPAAELLGASVEGNVETLLHALRYDITLDRVEAPTAALEYARRLAQHGVPVNALVRAYRIGQRRLNELIFTEARDCDVPEPASYAVLEAIAVTLFEYIDWISQQVVAVYEDERDRWLENQNSLRALRVREILTGKESVDVDVATTSIRYPLHWHHLALIIWYPDAGAESGHLARLQQFLSELSRELNASANPLFVAADASCGWCWLPYRAAVADADAAIRRFTLSRPDAPSVAIGAMARGVEGFRRSYQGAASAHRVALIGEQRQPTVIAASDPGISVVARLGHDVADTRAWVAAVLGNLATDDENDKRLRETLRVYLGCGANYKVAAGELNLHFNTVKYRIGRAIARRGRDIGDDRLEVELALLICHWYGAAALQPK
ncbi:MAG TPA: helix-turn-helix domain-containing protein [Mycobacterium sp.]